MEGAPRSLAANVLHSHNCEQETARTIKSGIRQH
jgi:hypothetical protein